MLLGAAGGPKWDTTDPHALRPEQDLLGPRRELGLFSNLRPVRPLPALYGASALKRDILEGTDLLLVRELTAWIYFGERTRTATDASDLCYSTVAEVERIARSASDIARKRRGLVHLADKANVLESSRQWREVVHRVHAEDYPDVELRDQIVDSCAMELIAAPTQFDVIVTDNLFGDILSDAAARLSGSLGMFPPASIGTPDGPGLFEPVHDSAPDIAGMGVADPLAVFLSAAIMLRYDFGMEAEAAALEGAVDGALNSGLRTGDLGGSATTAEALAAVRSKLATSGSAALSRSPA